jgi:hypothetical protein
MKTTKHILTAVLSGITVISFVGLATASDIAASPRLQQQLNERQKAFTIGVLASDAQSMPCSKCDNQYVTRTDPSARGAAKVTKVAEHTCPACQTTLTAQGQGKAVQQVANHSCSMGSADTALPCCGMKKSN